MSLQAFVSRSYHQEPILKVPEAQADLSFRKIRLPLLPGSATHALGWTSMKNTQNQADPSPWYTRLQHVQMVFFSGYPALRGSTDFAWCLVLCRKHVGPCTPTSGSRGVSGAGERPFSKDEKRWKPVPFAYATAPPLKSNKKCIHQGATDADPFKSP